MDLVWLEGGMSVFFAPIFPTNSVTHSSIIRALGKDFAATRRNERWQTRVAGHSTANGEEQVNGDIVLI